MAHVYGSLMAENWRSACIDFAIARFARLYPLFAASTMALVVIVGIFGSPPQRDFPVSFSYSALALQPLLLQQWFPGLNWNYPSWSISTEGEAYVFFVFAASILIHGKHPWRMTCCAIAVLAGLSIYRTGASDPTNGLPALLRTLSEFALGALVYRAHHCDTTSSRVWAAVVCIILLSLARFTDVDLFAVGAFACLIYYGANATNWFGRLPI